MYEPAMASSSPRLWWLAASLGGSGGDRSWSRWSRREVEPVAGRRLRAGPGRTSPRGVEFAALEPMAAIAALVALVAAAREATYDRHRRDRTHRRSQRRGR